MLNEKNNLAEQSQQELIDKSFGKWHRIKRPSYEGIYRGPEIPLDLPLDQWYIYLDNLPWHFRTVPREKWNAADWKEANSLRLRCHLIFLLRDMPLKNRDARYFRIKEFVRNGEDFDVPAEKQAYLFQ